MLLTHAGCILTYFICSTLFSRLFLSSMSMIACAKPSGSLHPRSHSPPPRLFLLSHPAWVTRSLQEVVPSFAVAKVYQIPNTNQIFPRKTSENMPQSCTHFPLNKTLTTTEKILRRRCNIPPLPLGILLKSVPKSSVSLRFRPCPTPKAPQDQGLPQG